MKRRLLIGSAVLAASLLCAGNALASSGPSWGVYARRAVQDLLGARGGPAGWNPKTGLWGGFSPPHWWQSAMAVTALARYGERSNELGSEIEHVLLRTYRLNRLHSLTPELLFFTNGFMDDTGWWGLGWLAASRYELYQRHNRIAAGKLLHMAEYDASFMAHQPRSCGAIQWQLGQKPHTLDESEFVELAARLAATGSLKDLSTTPTMPAAGAGPLRPPWPGWSEAASSTSARAR